MGKRVSVLVNVYNEEKNIGPFIGTLEQQTFQNFDVVFIDDGSTDATVEKIKELSGGLRMSVIRISHRGLKRARAFGFEKTKDKCDIVFIIDVDVVLEKDYIETIVKKFKHPKVGAASGYLKKAGDRWFTKGREALNTVFYSIRNRNDESDFLLGGHSAYRTKAVDEVGGFTTEGGMSGDIDISWKLRKGGWRLVTDFNAVAHHKEAERLSGRLRQDFKEGRRVIGTYFSHREKMLDWRPWSRFYPLVLIFLFFANRALFLFALLSTFVVVVTLTRKSALKERIYAWTILSLSNLAWSAGVVASLIHRRRVIDVNHKRLVAGV